MEENLTKTEVLIVGGGPAGMSAALWCADLGLDAILLEKAQTLGGQLDWIANPIENCLGLKCANGAEMREVFERSIANRKFERVLGAEAVSLDTETKTVSLADGRQFSGDAIIIATGVRRRKLDVPGEDKFRGRGILMSGSGERETVTGKRVLVVGGGDAAAENALILAEHASRVVLVHRRRELAARSEFREAINERSRIEKLFGHRPESINGDTSVESVTLRNLADDSILDVPVEYVLVRIGVEPNTDFLRDAGNILANRRSNDTAETGAGLERVVQDELGYVRVGRDAQTNIPGIFAAGDAANPISPTIPTATGTAATAAKAAFALLNTRKSV